MTGARRHDAAANCRGVDTDRYSGITPAITTNAKSRISSSSIELCLINLDALQEQLIQTHAGVAVPIDVSGRKSAGMGATWLTKYLHWKSRGKAAMKAISLLYHDVLCPPL